MPIVNLIQLRRGTSAQWSESNPILENGEPGFETDTLKFKIGDGIKTWGDLSFVANGSQVEQYNGVSNFPSPGSDFVLYVATSTNRIYRWNGSAYIQIVQE